MKRWSLLLLMLVTCALVAVVISRRSIISRRSFVPRDSACGGYEEDEDILCI